MTPIAISSLHPLLARWAPGCPGAVLTQELIEAAREFCQTSRWLRQTVYADTVATENTVTLTPEDSTVEVVGIKGVEYLGEPLKPSHPEEDPHEDGPPERYAYQPASEMLLFPTPDTSEADGLFINLILQPKQDAVSFPDTLTRNWDRKIAYGALSRLLAMPGAAWNNEQRSVYYEEKFHNAKMEAMARADMTHRQERFRTRAYYR